MSSQEAQDKALALAREATTFARSSFGKHYIERLQILKQDHLEKTMDLEYTDSFRAHHGSMAKALDLELDYFRTAQLFTEPNTMKRIVAKLGGKPTRQ